MTQQTYFSETYYFAVAICIFFLFKEAFTFCKPHLLALVRFSFFVASTKKENEQTGTFFLCIKIVLRTINRHSLFKYPLGVRS